MIPKNVPVLHKNCGSRFNDPEDSETTKIHDFSTQTLDFPWLFLVFLVRTSSREIPAADTLTARPREARRKNDHSGNNKYKNSDEEVVVLFKPMTLQ